MSGGKRMQNMRRSDRQVSEEQAMKVLESGIHGIFCTMGVDGYPYGVPLNYAVEDGVIYLHCATEGKKLQNLALNPKASLVVVGENEVLAEKFSMRYESVMAFGTVSLVTDLEDKIKGLMALVRKYSPEFLESGEVYARSAAAKTTVLMMHIEHVTGKERLA